MSENSADELEAIKRRKMQEMERRCAAMQKPEEKTHEVDPLTLVRSKLLGRGNEVLDAALHQYPKPTMEVVNYIANLYRTCQLNEDIPGEDLYELFQHLGMRVHLDTSITYIKDGKKIPLSQKFKKETT